MRAHCPVGDTAVIESPSSYVREIVSLSLIPGILRQARLVYRRVFARMWRGRRIKYTRTHNRITIGRACNYAPRRSFPAYPCSACVRDEKLGGHHSARRRSLSARRCIIQNNRIVADETRSRLFQDSHRRRYLSPGLIRNIAHVKNMLYSIATLSQRENRPYATPPIYDHPRYLLSNWSSRTLVFLLFLLFLPPLPLSRSYGIFPSHVRIDACPCAYLWRPFPLGVEHRVFPRVYVCRSRP